MGIPTIQDQRANAFGGTDGQTYYCLYERIHDTTPGMPKGWKCIAFGTFENAFRRILRYAAVIEEAFIRTKLHQNTPEAYVAHWLDLMGKAHDQSNLVQSIALHPSVYQEVPGERKSAIRARLVAIGQGEMYSALVDDYRFVNADLHRDAAALEIIFGDGGLTAPWRLLSGLPCLHGKARTRSIPARNATPAEMEVEVFALDEKHVLTCINGDQFLAPCKSWSVPQRYLESEAATVELSNPGTLAQVLAKLRAGSDRPAKLPSGTEVTIVRHVNDATKWQVGIAKRLHDKLRQCRSFSGDLVSFTVRFADISDDGFLYDLFHLHRNQLVWNIPQSSCGSTLALAA